ncbi:hypothetical protein BDP27DRAFT_1393990 [Rhodocollybia butyracea]|uniref:mRNA export factor GLE1 n=1 Tax=Rhodocollybia butyracea TaxID=206335 RepID=A0A9P5PGX3_9AGAR|nr:hypothetical protein BDP27DRAFT_1393990 [Rhodocollybia butyracea]
MRFSAPRSVSPSPERRPRKPKPKPRDDNINHASRRHTSTFGLNSSSEESESELELESDSGESVPESEDSFCYASESEVPPPPSKPKRLSSRPSHIEDTIAAIRLRTRHYDPYEEWEREMKKDSLRAAHKNYNDAQAKFTQTQNQRQLEQSRRLAAQFKQDELQILQKIDHLRIQQQTNEKTLQQRLNERNALEQDRVQARLDAEEKKRREEEERRMEEERKKRLEEERIQREREEEQRKKAEEQRKRDEEQRKKDEEERRLREEQEAALREARERDERLKAEAESRKAAGMTTYADDWKEARKNLQILKTQGTRVVKTNSTLKPLWSAGRRAITAKIGQLTNDEPTINRVSSQLIEILLPPLAPIPPPVYTALLSSLAKALVLQAETEITAEKRSAIPLAQVTFNCLERLEGFSEVLYAKMTQRIGPWLVPCPIPEKDFDGRAWKDAGEIRLMQGLYFEVLKIVPRQGPMKRMFQLPRYWTWMARMLGARTLLATSVGAEVLFIALDVLGADALQIWGHQFVKLLRLVYDGASEGLGDGKLMGGTSPDGIAARARVKLEVENIMRGIS